MAWSFAILPLQNNYFKVIRYPVTTPYLFPVWLRRSWGLWCWMSLAYSGFVWRPKFVLTNMHRMRMEIWPDSRRLYLAAIDTAARDFTKRLYGETKKTFSARRSRVPTLASPHGLTSFPLALSNVNSKNANSIAHHSYSEYKRLLVVQYDILVELGPKRIAHLAVYEWTKPYGWHRWYGSEHYRSCHTWVGLQSIEQRRGFSLVQAAFQPPVRGLADESSIIRFEKQSEHELHN
jgi:hypothetical protein